MEKFYSPKELAEILNISKTKTYELIYERKIASIRIGSGYRIRESDLKRFINKNIY